jgi:DNA repair exonuclease SbcCD nuclease subunit
MPKFLHTADWQIGRRYSRFAEEDAAVLSEARLTAIERLARLATDEGCDAVLVAGDVFDMQTVADKTIRRTFNSLAGFSGPWVLMPGNHDAALAESVWSRAERMSAVPTNVHLALQPGVIELEEQGISVLTAPLTQRHTFNDLTAAFDATDTPSGLLRIGLAHGSVEGILAEDIDSTNPIASDRAARARLDYLALGDWHGTRQIGDRTWYCGTPEPERFRNNEAGFALVVEIEEPGAMPRVTRHRTAAYHWEKMEVAFNVDSDVDAFVGELDAIPQNSVVDITLSGQVSLAGQARLIDLLSHAEGRHRSLSVDRTELYLEPTEEDVVSLQADGYLGDVIQQLREMQQLEASIAARDALGILAGLLRQGHEGAGK